MGSRPPTGSDVARLAGVSKSAVSRAFTGGIVSEDARNRIFEAAKTLRYRPSLTARSLTTSSSKLVGVAITHLDNQFYPEVVQKLFDRLAEAGFRMVLFVTHGESDMEPVLDELLGYRLDGVFLASSSMAAQLAEECCEANVPAIMFNNIDLDARVPGVATDGTLGGTTVARFLVAGGHRRLALITGLAESSTSVERGQAFIDAAISAGLPPPLVETGLYSFDGAYAATQKLLAQPDRPDAIFCVNDHMAFAALHAAHDAGLIPGRAISIVGFDDVQIAAWPMFSLTTYAQPIDAMIDNAVTRLVTMIGDAQNDEANVRLPGHLVVRGSARRPAGFETSANGQGIWRDEGN